MVPVLPGLYLGCGLPGAEEVGRGGVTALLSVDSEPPGAAAEAALEAVLHVPLLDEPRSDLLSRLDDCAAFVGRARERGGAVLVRCHSGVSRSVAVVTAYLMKANHLPFEEAYAFVRALRPEAKMNEGFEWQLKLYEKMGCEVDVTSSIYKQYCLQKVTEKYPELRNLPRDVFAVDPSTIPQAPSYEALYKCRKCRRLLFRSSSILAHMEGKGPAAFAHKRLPDPTSFQHGSQSVCSSYFVEPVQWMEPALLGVLEGQLLCPKCSSKLGSFHWHGEQCSCGHWVTPAFQIHKSRVDEVRGLPVTSLQTAR
ncbi:dual specificity protein phosphatase 12 isoform X1 [Eublepharis macularius]|uniref:Dual specificity protein phosphatase 12 n=1 Tax=Eublepharis macularius TaxID=481883 RepID=A0AA97KN40_EUBMA|nr:dual specificity protein phosphatase 12 isoform X1 [Eublepharis macularius]